MSQSLKDNLSFILICLLIFAAILAVAYILEKLLSRKGFCQTLYMKDIVATDNVRLQVKLHGSVYVHGLVQYLYLVKHLFPALCPLDGFFTVK